MENYDMTYEKVMEYARSLELSSRQSKEIMDKIVKDMELGILRHRNVNRKIDEMAYNMLFGENQSINSYQDILEMLGIENQWEYVKSELMNTTGPYDKAFFYLIPEASKTHRIKAKQIEIFLKNNLSRLQLSSTELKMLKNRLLRHAKNNEITAETMDKFLKMHLEETENRSLKMVKNQDFRELDKRFVAIKNPELALKFHEDDNLDVDSLVCYSYIDHFKGISFLVITTAFEGELNERVDFSKDYIILKKDVENEIVEFIDSCDDYMTYVELTVGDNDEYDEIRNYRLIDDARDQDNPDLVNVEFISPYGHESLQVRCENIICSKIIGEVADDSLKIRNLKKAMPVVVSYCYDMKDSLRLYTYLEGDFRNLSGVIEEINHEYERCPVKSNLIKLISGYREHEDFNEIIDTFHTVIFDHFRDLDELYKVLDTSISTG